MVSELPLPVLHQYSENQQQVFYLSKAAKLTWFPAKLIESSINVAMRSTSYYFFTSRMLS